MTEKPAGLLHWTFTGDRDYKNIKGELVPFVTRITKTTGKMSPEYQRFKSNVSEWKERFGKAVELSGKVESIQQLLIPLMQELETKPENRRLLAVVNLFRYLGLVESVGASMVDLLVLLAVANGFEFHVERVHDLPRIVHATTFEDIDQVPLAAKVAFLERSGLKHSSKLINRLLRNDIAHLNFDIDQKGSVSTRNCGNVDVNEKIGIFNRYFMMITLILSEEGLNRV